jgi:hypothetical protein
MHQARRNGLGEYPVLGAGSRATVGRARAYDQIEFIFIKG